jgi:carbon monoxide dehydrogenase subunit G
VSRLERSKRVDASPDLVWAVLADFGRISAWVPLIQHSCLLSDQTDGVGAVRRVQIARQTLVERVVTWAPGRELAYDIEGLPPFVGTARNTWRLVAMGDDSTDVVLTTDIDTGPNPAKMLIAKKVLERMALASDLMLAGLAAAAPERRDSAPQDTRHDEVKEEA